jgi:hypothetical protein
MLIPYQMSKCMPYFTMHVFSLCSHYNQSLCSKSQGKSNEKPWAPQHCKTESGLFVAMTPKETGQIQYIGKGTARFYVVTTLYITTLNISYAECSILFIAMLNVIMLSVVCPMFKLYTLELFHGNG